MVWSSAVSDWVGFKSSSSINGFGNISAVGDWE